MFLLLIQIRLAAKGRRKCAYNVVQIYIVNLSDNHIIASINYGHRWVFIQPMLDFPSIRCHRLREIKGLVASASRTAASRNIAQFILAEWSDYISASSRYHPA